MPLPPQAPLRRVPSPIPSAPSSSSPPRPIRGCLPRLIEPVAKLGAVPSRVHASRESGDGSELNVDLRLTGVAPRTAELIEYALRAVVGVRQVMAVIEPET